jgi:hypothetical protein
MRPDQLVPHWRTGLVQWAWSPGVDNRGRVRSQPPSASEPFMALTHDWVSKDRACPSTGQGGSMTAPIVRISQGRFALMLAQRSILEAAGVTFDKIANYDPVVDDRAVLTRAGGGQGGTLDFDLT